MEKANKDTLFGLKKEFIRKINEIFMEFPQVETAIIYGSRAKGNYRDGSDIDLTLIGKNLNLDIMNSIAMKLDDLLLPYFIDLSAFNQISNAELIDHIQRVGKTFYKRDS